MSEVLLLLACSIMEVSWYYTWVTFLTTTLLNRPFPFPEAAGAFGLSCLLTYLTANRGWRIIYLVALQAIFFIPLLIKVIKIFASWSPSFAAQKWLLADPLYGTSAISDWFVMILVILWVFPFWVGGISTALRPHDYRTVGNRFDLGILAFFILFAIELIFSTKPKISTEFFAFSFFLFSMLAIGTAKYRQSQTNSEYLPGFQLIGVILGFMLITVFLAAGLGSFFFPYLTVVATKSYDLIKEGAKPVSSLFLLLLRFLFGTPEEWQIKEVKKPVPQLPKLEGKMEFSWWMELIGRILTFFVWFLLAVVFLMLVGTIIYFLFQWLLSKTSAAERKKTNPLSFLLALMAWLKKIPWQRKIPQGAIDFFTFLEAWGRNSGIPRHLWETPREYEGRLAEAFPALAEDMGIIRSSYEEAVYGGITIDEERLSFLREAQRKLRHPRYFPRRIMLRLLRS